MANALAIANGYDTKEYYHIYREYQVFSSIKEMNETERLRLFTEGDKVKKGAKEFYSYLIRYSCKVIGVSWQLVETMAKGFGKSDRTIKRYISELVKADWIKVIRLKDGNLKGQNLYQIVKAYAVKLVEDAPQFDTMNVPSKMSPREGADEPSNGAALTDAETEGNHFSLNHLKSLNHLSLKDRKGTIENVPSNEDEAVKEKAALQENAYYDEIPPLTRLRLVAKNRSSNFVNGCFKRIVSAFNKTDLARYTSIRELDAEIANKIQYVSNKDKKGKINSDFFGYLYKAVLDLFKKIELNIAEDELKELLKDSEPIDFSKSPLRQNDNVVAYDFRKSAIYQAKKKSVKPSLIELIDTYGHNRELLNDMVCETYGVYAGQADYMIAEALGEDIDELPF